MAVGLSFIVIIILFPRSFGIILFPRAHLFDRQFALTRFFLSLSKAFSGPTLRLSIHDSHK